MARATQLLAYHGRTALLLGPVPRRANMVAANQAGPVHPHARTASVPLNDEIHPSMLSASRLLSLLLDAQPASKTPDLAKQKGSAVAKDRPTAVLVDLGKRRLDRHG
jgi:hypothetical protein